MDGPRTGALLRPLPWLLLALLVLGADQASKLQAVAVLGAPGAPRSVEVTGYFNLMLAYNRGAAFSLLSEASGWQGTLFTAIGVAASAGIVWLLARPATTARTALALALILGGALGNVCDRVRLGHVIDFLDFHWAWLEVLFPGGHFPAFNVADSAICCGAGLLVLDELLRALRARGA